MVPRYGGRPDRQHAGSSIGRPKKNNARGTTAGPHEKGRPPGAQFLLSTSYAFAWPQDKPLPKQCEPLPNSTRKGFLTLAQQGPGATEPNNHNWPSTAQLRRNVCLVRDYSDSSYLRCMALRFQKGFHSKGREPVHSSLDDNNAHADDMDNNARDSNNPLEQRYRR